MEAYRPIPLYGAGAEKEQATHKGNECVMSGGRHFSGCSRSDGAARAVRAAACRRGCHGCGYHWPVQSRARKKNPFDRAAKILLEGKDKSSAEQAASVSFSEEGMTVPAGGGKAEFVPYREFECAVETADSFLFVFGGRVLLLQKMDLKAECTGDFCSLISEKVKPYHSIA